MVFTRSPSPANANYDFVLRHERVKLFADVLKQFDANITRTVQAMREMASSLFLVGLSYHEVTLCVNNTNPNSGDSTGCSAPYSNQLVSHYGTPLQRAAQLFSAEMKSLKEGPSYVSYNQEVHQRILTKLHDVQSNAKRAKELGDAVQATGKKLAAAKSAVAKKEAKYLGKGRPLTESKRYEKQVGTMRKTDQLYATKLHAFNEAYEALMQRHLYVTGHTMDGFLDVNAVFLAQTLKALGCIAPGGVEAVATMVVEGQAMGQRLGVPPDHQLGSRLQRNANGGEAPVAGGGSASPSPSYRQRGTAHNFTSYYRNRRDDSSSAEGPLTARAADDRAIGKAVESRGQETPGAVGRRSTNPLPSTADPAPFGVCSTPAFEYSSVSKKKRPTHMADTPPSAAAPPPPPHAPNTAAYSTRRDRSREPFEMQNSDEDHGAGCHLDYDHDTHGVLAPEPVNLFHGNNLQRRSSGPTPYQVMVSAPPVEESSISEVERLGSTVGMTGVLSVEMQRYSATEMLDTIPAASAPMYEMHCDAAATGIPSASDGGVTNRSNALSGGGGGGAELTSNCSPSTAASLQAATVWEETGVVPSTKRA